MHQMNDMLHAWIDGELDPALETQFFSLLASDSDLRDKLRHMRNIRMEAQKFGAVVQPPADISDRVFARLGFAVPNESAASASRRPAMLAALGRAWAPVASAAAAAVITAILILGLRDPMNDAATQTLADGGIRPAVEQQETPTEDGRSARDEAAVEQLSKRNPATAPGSGRVTEARTDPSRQRSLRAVKPSSISSSAERRDDIAQHGDDGISSGSEPTANPRNDGSTEVSKSNTESTAGDAQVDAGDSGFADAGVSDDAHATSGGADIPANDPSWRNPLIEPAVPAANAMRESPAPAGTAPVDTRQYFPGLRPTDVLPALSVELRGMNTASFPSPTITTSSDPWMQNMAVAVFYTSGQHDLGLEFGQEPFAMHYHGVENGKAVRYEQNLLTPWLQASWRYRFRPFSIAGIEPYVTASLGSSLYFWPMARTGAGIMYMPDRRVRFHIGVEGSMLAYPYQQQWFTSRRVGLTYGLSVLF